jgi:hypothetical protein
MVRGSVNARARGETGVRRSAGALSSRRNSAAGRRSSTAMIRDSVRPRSAVLGAGFVLGVVLPLAGCGRVELGSDVASGPGRGVPVFGRRPPEPDFRIGNGGSSTEVGGPASRPVPGAGEDPRPFDLPPEFAQSPAEAGAPDASPDASPPVSFDQVPLDDRPRRDAGTADRRSCAQAPRCGVDGDSCCSRSVVPAGPFQLGQDGDNPGVPAFVDSFYLDEYEVTTGRFAQFLAEFGDWRAAGNPQLGAGQYGTLSATGWQERWQTALATSAPSARTSPPSRSSTPAPTCR